ncbi:MAG: hypothetical protein A4E53_02630 [Pelotomaculum sp. PtaB.Bin104]|nr:MAG: hypothetical protein A4E53_02630 [Pelotomaculum sp. PtaB.Bin104]
MNTEKTIRESNSKMMIALTIGIVLLASGVVLGLLDLKLVPNNKAIVGLSLIPLGVALANYLKIRSIKKPPQKMRSMIINESEESFDFFSFTRNNGEDING